MWCPGWVHCPPNSLIDGRDVAFGHNGFEAQDDVDAEEDGDAVVAIADIRFHVLLRVFLLGGGEQRQTDTSASGFGGLPKTPRHSPPPPKPHQEHGQGLSHDGVEKILGAGTRHHEKVAEEQILAATVIQESVVLAAEQ